MDSRRIFLFGVLGSVGLAAVGGMYAVLFEPQGELTWRLILSMLAVTLTGGFAMGAYQVMERGRWQPLMRVAMMLAGGAFLGALVLIWLGESLPWPRTQMVAKLTALAAIAAVGAVVGGHIRLLRLKDTPARLRWVEMGLVVVLGLMLGTAVVLEYSGPPSEWFYRAMAVVLILVGFGGAGLHVAERVQKVDQQINPVSTPLELTLTCPRCQQQQTVETGASRCRGCRLWFNIEIEEPRCPGCGYLLHKLTEPVCPECGRSLSEQEIARE